MNSAAGWLTWQGAGLYKASLNLLRGLLLLVSVIAAVVAFVWGFDPALVTRCDRWINARYVESHSKVLRSAEEMLQVGETARGISLMASHLEDIHWVKKTDRLSAHKRKVHSRLIGEYLKLDQEEEALRVYDSLIQFDSRDLESALKRATLQLEVPGRRAQGEEEIARLYRLAPTIPVTSRFLDFSLKKRDLVESIRSLYRYSRLTLAPDSLGRREWRVFWSSGDKFSRKRVWKGAPELLAGNRVALTAELPVEGARLNRFRIDFPGRLYAVISDFVFSFEWDGRRLVLDKQTVDYKVRRIELRCGALITRHQNGFMFFNLPEEISLQAGVKFRFEARLEPYMPKDFEDLIGDQDLLSSTRETLRASGDPRLDAFLASMVEEHLRLRIAC